MPRIERQELQSCTHCGASHSITYEYAKFGPANDHERVNCRSCGELLVRERCVSITAKLIPTISLDAKSKKDG